MENYLLAALLGVIEGLTEFLPVSSTGHLILFVDLLGFKAPPGQTFEVMIQLGAILALVVLYFRKIWQTLTGLPSDPAARRFATVILAAFIPAMILGAAFHSQIKAVLFSPVVVAIALIVGGVVILIVERMQKRVLYHTVDDVPVRTGFLVGLAQAMALVPGVSRSGATIIGGLLLGLERRAAAEFSFFLSMPTMGAAFAYDAYKNRDLLSFDDAGVIAVGFIAAFIAALLVVKPFLAIVSNIGFAPFAYYRIALGALVLGLVYSGAAVA
ncbi:MAG: undecaprenyl-diphosphate phosphatase [Chitinophagales bacterium]|nr:undecaprenyl-diphosphate phosphatase [Hyphomicrobiales bacterium]